MTTMFKKALSAICIGSMALSSLAMSAAAVDDQPSVPEVQESTELLTDISPCALLCSIDLDTGVRGQDETPYFAMIPGNGTKLRWYVKNNSDSRKMYVFLYDRYKGEIVSAMSPYMVAGEERTITYDVGSDSELCQFKIMIESADGGQASAYVRAKQIR